MAKTRKGTRKKKHRRRRTGSSLPKPLLGVVGALAAGLLIWGALAASEDRYLQEYRRAGDGAFGRGNYTYAERMYKEALDEAIRLEPRGSEVARSLRDMSKAYRATGKNKLAAAMLERARALRQR